MSSLPLGFEPRLPWTENELKKKEDDKERLRGQTVEPEDIPPTVENVVVTEVEGEENEDQTEVGEQAGVEIEDEDVAEENTAKEENPSEDNYMESNVTPVGCITLVSE